MKRQKKKKEEELDGVENCIYMKEKEKKKKTK